MELPSIKRSNPDVMIEQPSLDVKLRDLLDEVNLHQWVHGFEDPDDKYDSSFTHQMVVAYAQSLDENWKQEIIERMEAKPAHAKNVFTSIAVNFALSADNQNFDPTLTPEDVSLELQRTLPDQDWRTVSLLKDLVPLKAMHEKNEITPFIVKSKSASIDGNEAVKHTITPALVEEYLKSIPKVDLSETILKVEDAQKVTGSSWESFSCIAVEIAARIGRNESGSLLMTVDSFAATGLRDTLITTLSQTGNYMKEHLGDGPRNLDTYVAKDRFFESSKDLWRHIDTGMMTVGEAYAALHTLNKHKEELYEAIDNQVRLTPRN